MRRPGENRQETRPLQKLPEAGVRPVAQEQVRIPAHLHILEFRYPFHDSESSVI